MYFANLKKISKLSLFVLALAIPSNALAARVAIRSDMPITPAQKSEIQNRYGLQTYFSRDNREAFLVGDASSMLAFTAEKPSTIDMFVLNGQDSMFVPSVNFSKIQGAKFGIPSVPRTAVPATLKISGNTLTLTNAHNQRSFDLVFSTPILEANYISAPSIDPIGDICDTYFLEVQTENGSVNYFGGRIFYSAEWSGAVGHQRAKNAVYHSYFLDVPNNRMISKLDKCVVVHY